MRSNRSSTSLSNSFLEIPGRRPFGPGDFLIEWSQHTTNVEMLTKHVRGKGKLQSLANGQSRDVNIIWGSVRRKDDEHRHQSRLTFLIVHHFALVILLHFFGTDSSIRDIARHFRITFPLVGDCPKEGGTSSAGAAKNETHFPRLECTRIPVNVVGQRKLLNFKTWFNELVDNRLGSACLLKLREQHRDQAP
jgi:hypothetical protein